jgi:hypothetical protein
MNASARRGSFRRRLRWTALLVLAAGVWAFARRGHADAPPGRFTFPNDGVVMDTQTGLVWQRVEPADGYSWSQAGSYCQSLDLGGTGWRLPSMKELQTIVDIGREIPAIDPTVFPDATSAQYWTSSAQVSVPTYAWVVDFRIGAARTASSDQSNRVRCVR